VIEAEKASLWNQFSDTYNLTRLAAIASHHSSDWLHALPISNCGLRLDNESVRVAVGLRLGLNICVPHTCQCGALVDARGLHGLSCKLAFGRMARHQHINDLIWRAVNKADVPAVKEPVGLFRSDGKRPDGKTLIPWYQGKRVTWDVTVINTLAESYVCSNSVSPGYAAELAAERKLEKYSSLPNNILFQPLAFETLGPINVSGIDFLSDLGNRLKKSSGEPRSTEFLFQQLSIAVQIYNSVAFNGTFSFLVDSDM